MNDNDISDIIANANPMPVDDSHDDHHLSPAETKLCEAIMSLPTLIPTDETLPSQPSTASEEPHEQPAPNNARRHRNRWPLVGAGTVAAALAALLIITLPSNDQSNIALAEWTPTPQPVTIDEQTAIIDACGQLMPEFAAPITDGVLVDRRGDIAAVAATSGDTRLSCATRLVEGTWSPFAGSAGSIDDRGRPQLMQAWNIDGAEINTIYGSAPDAVTVEVDAPNLPTSVATVVDGRYIVWLPKAVDWDQIDLGIQVRYLNDAGQTAQTIDL